MSSPHQYEHFDVSHIYLLTIFLKFYFSPPSFLTFFEKRAVKNSAQPYTWIFFTKIIVQHPKNPKTPKNLPPNSTVTGSGISTQLFSATVTKCSSGNVMGRASVLSYVRACVCAYVQISLK